ncbi:hypothetical protein ACE414_03005 [Alteromonas macleodii]|uniref:ApeA N-terminal domain 1-containing protein n=1 Tax=Alteromonas macleodii TaxID=28108 RepID=UPI00364BF432
MEKEILGTFTISNNEQVNGSLKKTGEFIKLTCWSKSDFSFDGSTDAIYGLDQQLNTLSLLNCFGDVCPAIRNNTKFFTSEVSAYLLISGSKKVGASDKFGFASIEVKNPKRLLTNADDLMENIVKEYLQEGNSILDFVNLKTIFSADTSLGEVSLVCNSSIERTSSELSLNLQSKLFVLFDFQESIVINDVLHRVKEVCQLLRFISGNEIYFENIVLRESEQSIEHIEVLSNNFVINENYNPSGLSRPLIDIGHPKFNEIMKSWFKDRERAKPRYNFYNNFFQVQYNEARMISSASVFDILYGTGGKKTLHKVINEKIGAVKTLVKKEFDTSEPIREDLLRQISNVKRIAHKDRIEKRIDLIDSQDREIGNVCKKIRAVLRYALSARNVFVHGTPSNIITTEDVYDYQSLFTNIFEFVYITSELVEAGWDMNLFPKNSWNHQIRQMQINLANDIDEFLSTIETKKGN